MVPIPARQALLQSLDTNPTGLGKRFSAAGQEAARRNGRALVSLGPDLTLHLRQDVLEEIDGWMLRGGIQDVHDERLEVLPASGKPALMPAVWITATASFLHTSLRPLRNWGNAPHDAPVPQP